MIYKPKELLLDDLEEIAEQEDKLWLEPFPELWVGPEGFGRNIQNERKYLLYGSKDEYWRLHVAHATGIAPATPFPEQYLKNVLWLKAQRVFDKDEEDPPTISFLSIEYGIQFEKEYYRYGYTI
jgi:hypothetical protein